MFHPAVCSRVNAAYAAAAAAAFSRVDNVVSCVSAVHFRTTLFLPGLGATILPRNMSSGLRTAGPFIPKIVYDGTLHPP